jgi:hypothetical protein
MNFTVNFIQYLGGGSRTDKDDSIDHLVAACRIPAANTNSRTDVTSST